MVVSLTQAIGDDGLLRRSGKARSLAGASIGYHSRRCFAMANSGVSRIRHTDCKAATLRMIYGLNRQICGDHLTDSCYLSLKRIRDFGYDL
jgi:hypothetical protein